MKFFIAYELGKQCAQILKVYISSLRRMKYYNVLNFQIQTLLSNQNYGEHILPRNIATGSVAWIDGIKLRF